MTPEERIASLEREVVYEKRRADANAEAFMLEQLDRARHLENGDRYAWLLPVLDGHEDAETEEKRRLLEVAIDEGKLFSEVIDGLMCNG